MKYKILALALLMAACAQPAAQIDDEACAAPAESRAVAQMYFGRNIGGSLGVSEEAWSDFVAREITPRFPDGLAIAEAEGQWRDAETGDIVREPSKQLVVFPCRRSCRPRRPGGHCGGL